MTVANRQPIQCQHRSSVRSSGACYRNGIRSRIIHLIGEIGAIESCFCVVRSQCRGSKLPCYSGIGIYSVSLIGGDIAWNIIIIVIKVFTQLVPLLPRDVVIVVVLSMGMVIVHILVNIDIGIRHIGDEPSLQRSPQCGTLALAESQPRLVCQLSTAAIGKLQKEIRPIN